jgi:hypothetical protein
MRAHTHTLTRAHTYTLTRAHTYTHTNLYIHSEITYDFVYDSFFIKYNIYVNVVLKSDDGNGIFAKRYLLFHIHEPFASKHECLPNKWNILRWQLVC